MLKFVKIVALALAIGLAGCSTVSQEELTKVRSLTRATGQFKSITEGRIVETRIGKPPVQTSLTDTVALGTKSQALQGIGLVLGTIDLIDKSADVFYVKYKEIGSDHEKLMYSRTVPARPDLFTEGNLFRHFVTQDGFSYIRLFYSEDEFQAFNR